MEGLDERGLEIGLWQWLDKRANRKSGIVTSLDLIQVEEEGARRVLGSRSSHNRDRIRDTMRNLIDRDVLEVVDGSGNPRLKVLVKPPPRKISKEDLPLPRGVAASGVSLVPTGTGVTKPTTSVGGPEGPQTEWSLDRVGGRAEGKAADSLLPADNDTCPPSAQKYVRPPRCVELARDVFPQLLREQRVGIRMPQGDWPILAKNLRGWRDKYQISYSQIELMMREFMLHPEWCSHSRSAPWKVFLARRSQILELMQTQAGWRRQQSQLLERQPHRRSVAEIMARRHTPRAISPA